MTALLRITNGSETVDLLNEFSLVDWEPTIQDWKDGGLYADSPLADLRQPVDVHLSTALETFELTLTAPNQDALAEKWQELRRLLNQAVRYWVDDWRTTPVWLEARSGCETNTRYAVIYNWRTPADAAPYAPPFTNSPPIAANRQLILERGPWLESPPGVGVCVPGECIPEEGGGGCEISKTYITNHVAPAGKVDRIVFFDKSTGTYTNIVISGGGTSLFPVPVEVDDALYFGRRRDPLTSNYFPFSSILVHLKDSGGGGSGYTGVWQIYAGGAWVACGGLDETNGLKQDGWNEFNFVPPSTWNTLVVNSISGLWVRFLITGVGGVYKSPNALEVTSTTKNTVAVQASDGDLPALLRCKLKHLLTNLNVAYIGSRTKQRGTDFTSCLNFSTVQNPPFANVTVFGGATFTTAYDTPTGIVVTFTPGGASPEAPRAAITITDQVWQYHGAYRVFLRCHDTSSPAGKFILRLAATQDNVQFYSSQRFTTSTVIYQRQLIDLGMISITPRTPGVESYQLVFLVYIESLAGAATLRLFDLILIPADEWFGEFRISPDTVAADYTSYTDIDGIKLRANNIAVERVSITGKVYSPYISITHSPPQIPAGEEVILHVITRDSNSGASNWYNDNSVTIERQARYYSLRGGA